MIVNVAGKTQTLAGLRVFFCLFVSLMLKECKSGNNDWCVEAYSPESITSHMLSVRRCSCLNENQRGGLVLFALQPGLTVASVALSARSLLCTSLFKHSSFTRSANKQVFHLGTAVCHQAELENWDKTPLPDLSRLSAGVLLIRHVSKLGVL